MNQSSRCKEKKGRLILGKVLRNSWPRNVRKEEEEEEKRCEIEISISGEVGGDFDVASDESVWLDSRPGIADRGLMHVVGV